MSRPCTWASVRYRMGMAARPRKTATSKDPAVRRLGPDDWTGAALAAIAEGGIANVSVERLAVGLATTKGSFYWHFKDRAALIVAALERWEADYTDGIIADRTATTDGPAARFRALLGPALAESAGTRIDANLAADADDPSVADALRRVSAKRLAFVDEIFAELRSDGGSDRALLAFCAYLGMTQLQRIAPQLVPKGRRRARFVDHVVDVLTTG